MKILLDTNAFLRHIAGQPIPRRAQRILFRHDTEVLVSVATCWEIVMKSQLGISASVAESAVHAMGAALLPIRITHLEVLSRLELFPDHKDPFDRMLIAQAIAEEAAIISSDRRFPEYRQARVIWD